MHRSKHMRPWWSWVLGAILVVLVVSAISGGDDERPTSTKSPTSDAVVRTGGETTAAPSAREEAVASTDAQPVASLADARSAADSGQYAHAVSIASGFGRGARLAIRQRIANRIARRAAGAVRAGNRRRASSLLVQAARYPATAATRGARADYAAAQARATARRAQLRLAAAQRRAERIAARAAKKRAAAKRATQSPPTPDCDPSYSGACLKPGSPDYDCLGGSGNGPDYTGTVQVVGDDHFDLDRDGDGTGCDG